MWRDEKIKIDIPESAGVIYTNKKSFDTFSENLDYERYLLSDYQ
jgi:hypothetical protein